MTLLAQYAWFVIAWCSIGAVLIAIFWSTFERGLAEVVLPTLARDPIMRQWSEQFVRVTLAIMTCIVWPLFMIDVIGTALQKLIEKKSTPSTIVPFRDALKEMQAAPSCLHCGSTKMREIGPNWWACVNANASNAQDHATVHLGFKKADA